MAIAFIISAVIAFVVFPVSALPKPETLDLKP